MRSPRNYKRNSRTRAIDTLLQDAWFLVPPPTLNDPHETERGWLSQEIFEIVSDPAVPLDVVERLGFLLRQTYAFGEQCARRPT